jgi:hypothetical protein
MTITVTTQYFDYVKHAGKRAYDIEYAKIYRIASINS